ncbi:MAG: HigA family addiction module antidote protein [Desulfuromonadales bacterium]|nr:HigA family addiction module antidote protein [Desulfuromonadales bacterium]
MSKATQNQFMPNYAVPPGETLLDTLEAIGMSQAELANRTGRPKKTINEIIKGKVEITSETALQLERVLGIPAGFWNNLERNYQDAKARLAEQERLMHHIAWLREIPVATMVKQGWIQPFRDKVQQLQEVLNYFGVASPELWQARWHDPGVAYRESSSFRSHPGAVAAWLRKGELEAHRIASSPFDPTKFKEVLGRIRGITRHLPEDFQPEIERLCAEAGVAVVIVPELPNIRISGATWWLNPNKAVILLTLRYKSDDQLWFSFFHEAGHILLHGKKDVFLEGELSDGKEEEANSFAGDFLIPARKYQQFITTATLSKMTIHSFADELGIAPGIIVGRLQHDKRLPFTHCNELKRKLVWK